MMKNLKKIYGKIILLVFVLLYFFLLPLTAEISFKYADLNNIGNILFSTEQESSNGERYSTLYLYTKKNKRIKQITFFPENLELLGNKRFLQIFNNNSLLKIDLITGNTYSQSDFESNSQVLSSKFGSLKNIQNSPDGRWLSVIDHTSEVFGRLILIDTVTEKKYVLSEKIIRNMKAVKWSPDSKTFLYEENGTIYFAKTNWLSLKKNPNKKFRFLAKASIKNVRWISSSEFIFLSGKIFYKVNINELFTKSLYNQIFPMGDLLGRLPENFNINYDKIFIAPNGKSAVLIKSRRSVYFFNFDGNNYISTESEGRIPFLLLSENTAENSVYWKNNLPILFSKYFLNGKIVLNAWKIAKNTFKFKKIPLDKNTLFLASSPKFKTVAVRKNDEVIFYDTDNDWTQISSFSDEKIISAVWINETEIFLGGETSLIKYTLDSDGTYYKKERICLTGVKDFSWSRPENKILIKLADNNEIVEYAHNCKVKIAKEKKLCKKNTSNSKNRIYIDYTNTYFKNMLYIRSLEKNSSSAIFDQPISLVSKKYINYKEKSNNTHTIFSHGKRTGKKQIALVFDVLENMDDIPNILYILKKHNIKATFFLNGVALTHNPSAVKEISKAGHQCASLFFTRLNLSSSDYIIDDKFIQQGLARNEDDFYNITGKELSLIWHTPHYKASPMLINAGKQAGYLYISPDIKTDKLLSNTENFNCCMKNNPELIEYLCKLIVPGSIIAISLDGKSTGKNKLFNSYIELLIQILEEKGYSITDLKNLMK